MRRRSSLSTAIAIYALLSSPFAQAGSWPSGDPDYAGEGVWGSVLDWSGANCDEHLVAVHMVNLPTGRVLVIGFNKQPTSSDITRGRTFDPSSETLGSWITSTLPTNDLFCAGHTGMPDGRVFFSGGDEQTAHGHDGMVDINVFDPDGSGGDWIDEEDMEYKRWYPTNLVLHNGRILVLSGEYRDNTGAIQEEKRPEIFDPETSTWTELDDYDYIFQMEAHRKLGNYPRIFNLSNGEVAYVGPTWRTYALDTDADDWTWLGGVFSIGRAGCAVMYRPDHILRAGGFEYKDPNDPNSPSYSIDTAEYADFYEEYIDDPNDPDVDWTTADMNHPRHHHNLTILADGTVLASGGTSGDTGPHGTYGDPEEAQYECEVFDPDTGSWALVASMASGIPRMYHASAVLLQDGRVLAGGGQSTDDGGVCGAGDGIYEHPSAQIYYPPYLYDSNGDLATRPTITSVPALVDRGVPFAIETPNADDIDRVSLVRLGATTHSHDQGQLYVPLEFQLVGDDLVAEVPEAPAVTPAGHYMLFILDDDGVPSVSEFVLINGRDRRALELTSAMASSGSLTCASLAKLEESDDETCYVIETGGQQVSLDVTFELDGVEGGLDPEDVSKITLQVESFLADLKGVTNPVTKLHYFLYDPTETEWVSVGGMAGQMPSNEEEVFAEQEVTTDPEDYIEAVDLDTWRVRARFTWWEKYPANPPTGWRIDVDRVGLNLLLDPGVGLGMGSRRPLEVAVNPDPEVLRVFPNPSDGHATIRYQLHTPGEVSVQIVDASGRVVRFLAREEVSSGEHVLVWDGRDEEGREQPAGVYFTRIAADGVVMTEKMLVLE